MNGERNITKRTQQDPVNIEFRQISAQDESFLYRLYASTRQEELAQTGWDEIEKENFLKMQFAAQHKFYREQFSRAAFNLILLDKMPIGRLYLDRRRDEIRIIDIALLPAYRCQGLGTKLMNDILTEARTRGLPVRIHVESFNRALGLYQRLGFRKIGDHGVYYLMEWTPDGMQGSLSPEK